MLLRKLAINYGPGALRALGGAGYARYLVRSAAAVPAVLSERNLRPVDRAMHGRLGLRHPLGGAHTTIDLDAYRAGDEREDTYAFGLVREIWMRNVYLAPFRLPATLDAVVDLGANRGIFALQACRIARLVVAVEALADYAGPLRANLDANGFDNLRLIHAFAGGPGFLTPDGAPAVTLAQVFAAAEGHRVDLVKVDIEGSEFGLDLAPLAHAARLAMELHPQYGATGPLLAELRALGFDCRLRDEELRPAPEARAAFVYGINRAFPDAQWNDHP
jgi:hypothetical protein